MRKHANNRITEITVYPLKITIFAEKSRTFLSVPLRSDVLYFRYQFAAAEYHGTLEQL